MKGLEQLRAAYVPRLRAQLDELDSHLTDGAAEAATRIAHKIAGAAGSYGLEEVSAVARRLEHALEGGAAPDGQRAELAAMRAAIPEVRAPDASPVILVLGPPVASEGVVAVDDPVEALQVAMDRPLRALVVPYTSGARGGRALLRSIAGLSLEDVPIFVTEVSPSEAERVRGKVGAREAFPGPFDEAVLELVEGKLA